MFECFQYHGLVKDTAQFPSPHLAFESYNATSEPPQFNIS